MEKHENECPIVLKVKGRFSNGKSFPFSTVFILQLENKVGELWRWTRKNNAASRKPKEYVNSNYSSATWKTKRDWTESTIGNWNFVSTFQLGEYFMLKTTPKFQFAEQATRQKTRNENVTYNYEFFQMPFTSMSLSENGKNAGYFGRINIVEKRREKSNIWQKYPHIIIHRFCLLTIILTLAISSNKCTLLGNRCNSSVNSSRPPANREAGM